MDRITRKELKSDKFAETVGHTLEEIVSHRQQVTRYSAIAAVVIVLIVAVVGYFRWQANQRAEAFRAMLRVMEAPISPEANVAGKVFQTEEEKKKAVDQAVQDLISAHGGTNESAMAHYFVASDAIEAGDLEKALSETEIALREGDSDTRVLAKFTRANILRSQGKRDEAEKLYRELLNETSGFVTRDQVVIALAETLKKSKPDEAVKLLEPLRTTEGAAQRMAAKLIGEIKGDSPAGSMAN